MTRRELRKLDTIIAKLERLRKGMDDQVADNQLAVAHASLVSLYHNAKRDCDATENSFGDDHPVPLPGSRKGGTAP